FSAALVKFSSLTVARKYRTWCISIAGFYQSISQPALAFDGRGRQIASRERRNRRPRTGSTQAMNIAIRPANSKTGQALAGKVSLVPGCMSGIGLGIARVFAAAGSEIVLNGFGKPEEVVDVQARIAADFKVRVSYSGADMSKPQAIREMIEETLQSCGRDRCA